MSSQGPVVSCNHKKVPGFSKQSTWKDCLCRKLQRTDLLQASKSTVGPKTCSFPSCEGLSRWSRAYEGSTPPPSRWTCNRVLRDCTSGEHLTQLVLQPLGWPDSQASSQTGPRPSLGWEELEWLLCLHIPTRPSTPDWLSLHHELSPSLACELRSFCSEQVHLMLFSSLVKMWMFFFESFLSPKDKLKHFGLCFCKHVGKLHFPQLPH